MDINVGLLDLIKLGAKLFNHRILQFRLTTNETEVRQIQDGKIKGVKRLTIYDDNYWAFEGIPYAKPPLGELRFRAPQPAEPWDSIKDCTRCRSKPLQKHMVLHITEGSEDCLYLNVYSKKLSSEKPLSVMVWFYGGGFQIGEATRDLYSPDYFMHENIVLVTVNYRLGSLGFLCLAEPDLQVPGNAGLKDQILALQWVNKNIDNFNGDAQNITIFGESAGGTSVHYMMLCERAEGLFHKAILQSGTILRPSGKFPHKNMAYRLGLELGFKGLNNDREVLRFLSKQDASKIVRADNRLMSSEEKRNFMFIAFEPVVEPYVTKECVLAKDPLELMRTSWSNRIPVILGYCSSEGLFLYQIDRKLLKDLNDCIRLLPQEIRQNLNEAEAHEMGLKLKKAHFGQQDPGAEESFLKFLDLITYKNFLHGIHRTFLSRLAHASSTAPTFLYRFDFDSINFNHYRVLKCGTSVRGVSHADDLSYLFYSLASWKLSADTKEFKTIQRMISMWTAFAADSDPNCTMISPTIWQPASCNDKVIPKCLNISDTVEFINMPEMPKLAVWNSLYEKQELF